MCYLCLEKQLRFSPAFSRKVSYAGLFDSTQKLKCGNDNAVTAAKEWIYNEALGRLHSKIHIKAPSTLFFDIPRPVRAATPGYSCSIQDVITQNPQSENANLRNLRSAASPWVFLSHCLK